jgi:hypothetical protein
MVTGLWRFETVILSRNQKDLGVKVPEVKDSIAALDIQDVIIDGEIVALDEKGRSSFQLLQSFGHGSGETSNRFLRLGFAPTQRPRPSQFTDRRTEGKAGRTAEKASGCSPILGLFYERYSGASGPGSDARTGRLDR